MHDRDFQHTHHTPQEPARFPVAEDLGNDQPKPEHTILDILGDIPEAFEHLGRVGHELHAVLHDLHTQNSPIYWINIVGFSNVAGTASGSTAYLDIALGNVTDKLPIELADVTLGASAAGTIQLLGVSSPNGYAGAIRTRVLGTVRTTTNVLTVSLPGNFIINQGENVAVLCTSSNSISLDFTGRYRRLQ
jgi:hypothetical protein